MTHKSMLSCVATEKPMTQNTVTEAIKIANKTTVSFFFGAKISWERKHHRLVFFVTKLNSIVEEKCEL